MITACIATDVSLFSEGLSRILTEERGVLITAIAANGDDVLRSCGRSHPDVAILHTSLPGVRTAELLRRLKQHGSTMGIILFGRWESDSIAPAQLWNTAALIDERDNSENFVRAVHRVHGGATFCSESVNKLIADDTAHTSGNDRSIEDLLTPTEVQIFHALTENCTSQEIARSMFISYRTVQKHRSNMTRKLKLQGSNALLTYALRHGRE